MNKAIEQFKSDIATAKFLVCLLVHVIRISMKYDQHMAVVREGGCQKWSHGCFSS